MEEYLEQYNRLLNEKNEILETLKELENNDIIKRYKALLDRSIELKFKEQVIYEKMIIEKISNCSHVFNSDGYCLKCGLNTSLVDSSNIKNKDDMIIHNYLVNHPIDKDNSKIKKKTNS